MRTRMRAFNSGPMGSSAARLCASSTSPTGAALSRATGIDIVLVREWFDLPVRRVRATVSRPRSSVLRAAGAPSCIRHSPRVALICGIADQRRHAGRWRIGRITRVSELRRGERTQPFTRAMEERAHPMTTNNLPAPLASVPAPERAAETQAFRRAGFPEYESGLDWRRALSAVLRFKWVILLVTVLGTAAGVAATRVVRPIYSAQSTVWIDAAERRTPDRGPIRQSHLLDPQAWVALLKSYVVLDRVVRDQRLFLEPQSPADAAALAALRVTDQYRPGAYRLTMDEAGRTWTLATTDGLELDRGALGDSIGTRVGLMWAPARGTLTPGQRAQFTLAPLRDAARGAVGGGDGQLG